jgi:hypothetical protein
MIRRLKSMMMVMLTFLSFHLPIFDPLFDRETKQRADAKALVQKADAKEYHLLDVVVGYSDQYEDIELTHYWLTERFIMDEAYKQGLQKFGQAISPKIEPAYKELIMPSLKQAVSQLLSSVQIDDLAEITVSHAPAPGRGEKIMHVYNKKTGDDLLRFHVRLNRPPKKGHVFQFHYHVLQDNFHCHYELGTIYWGKNEPPLYSA